MSHDFKTAVVELRGVNETHRIEKPYGGKNISTLCDLFADSVRTGVFNSRLPLMEEIRERRRNMTEGYGLLRHVKLSHS